MSASAPLIRGTPDARSAWRGSPAGRHRMREYSKSIKRGRSVQVIELCAVSRLVRDAEQSRRRQAKRHAEPKTRARHLDGRIASAMLCLWSRYKPAPCAKPSYFIHHHFEYALQGMKSPRRQRKQDDRPFPFQRIENSLLGRYNPKDTSFTSVCS